MRWFMSLSVRRKILLFLAPGMLTLVWDAFVAHWSWNNSTMKWNQYPPVIYGALAFVALMVAALGPLSTTARDRLTQVTGAVGMLVGGAGIYFHGIDLLESLEGEEMTFTAIGKTVALAPPLFAPAAFAGVGLLLLLLHRIARDTTPAVSAI